MIVPLLVLAAAPAFAQVANEYRQFPGIDTRKLIWFLAQAQKIDPGQGIKGHAFISFIIAGAASTAAVFRRGGKTS